MLPKTGLQGASKTTWGKGNIASQSLDKVFASAARVEIITEIASCIMLNLALQSFI
jgi:hypothetical protein